MKLGVFSSVRGELTAKTYSQFVTLFYTPRTYILVKRSSKHTIISVTYYIPISLVKMSSKHTIHISTLLTSQELISWLKAEPSNIPFISSNITHIPRTYILIKRSIAKHKYSYQLLKIVHHFGNIISLLIIEV